MKKKNIRRLLVVCLVLILAAAVIGFNSALAEQANVLYQADSQTAKPVVFRIGVYEYIFDGEIPGLKMDVAPFISNDRTYMPVRFLANALGVSDSNINWDASTQTVTLVGKSTLSMTIGKAEVVIDGESKAIDVAPMLVDPGRTMLPARFVAEGLGYQVDWDAATQTVVCWPAGQPKPDVSEAVDYLVEKTQPKPVQPVGEVKDVGGFKVPVNTDLKVSSYDDYENMKVGTADFLIRLYKPLDKQYEDLTVILSSKFDSQVVAEVVEYTKQKTHCLQDLPLKTWSVPGYSIEVGSEGGNDCVPVLARKI